MKNLAGCGYNIFHWLYHHCGVKVGLIIHPNEAPSGVDIIVVDDGNNEIGGAQECDTKEELAKITDSMP